jgi:hypothetical protein
MKAMLRAFGRALWLAFACLLLSACGGGDKTSQSDSTNISAASPDGASATLEAHARAAHSGKTFRVARNSTGATALPEDVVPISPIYAFTPMGLVAPGTEIRIPFDAGQLPEGQQPRLLVSVPGEPWVEILGTKVIDGKMVARVPRLSHALVAAGGRSTVRASRVRIASAGDDGEGTPITVRLSATANPFLQQLGAPGSGDPTGVYLVDRPVQVTQEVAYALPVACSSMVLQVFAMTQPIAGDGEMHLLLQQAVTSPQGVFNVVQDFVSGPARMESLFVFSFCESGAWGAQGPGFIVDLANELGFPSISRHPQDVSTTDGTSVTFSVEATGDAFVWYRSNDGGQSYQQVPGSGSSVSHTASAADDGSLWRVDVITPRGKATSMPARLSVSSGAVAPTVTADPSSMSVVEGETASFTVVGTGSPVPAITWQRRDASSAAPEEGWTTIAGASTSTFTTSATSLQDNGAQYRAVLTNTAGTVASLPATLTVQQRVTLPSIVTPPVPLAVPAGQSGAFAVVASGTAPLSFQWFKNGQPIVGANGSEALIRAETTDIGQSYQITVEVSNPAGVVTSTPVLLTVSTPPGTTRTETLVTASSGGVAEAAVGEGALSIPADSLTTDTLVQMTTTQASDLPLTEGVTALGDALEVGPSDVSFLAPATLSFPSPEDIPDGKVLVLVHFAPATASAQGASGSRVSALGVNGINLRRTAQAFSPRARVLAVGTPSAIQCLGPANKVGGRVETLVSGAARVALAAADPSSCTGTAPAAPLGNLPSTQEDPCTDGQYAPSTDGASVALVSRHVSCQVGSGEVSLVNPTGAGDYGNFRLEMRLGTHGPAKSLDKKLRVQFRMTQLSPGSLAAPQIRIRPRFACSPQLEQGTCTHAETVLTVNPGSGWTSPKDITVNFAWGKGAPSQEKFFFGDTQVDVAVGSQPFEQAPVMGFSAVPPVRCDKGLTMSGGQGCVHSDAAAVLVFAANDPVIKEAAEHIREAQLWGSPGAFTLATGTRAVAAGGNSLRYAKNRADLNRQYACERTSSLFNTRSPQLESAYCAGGGAGCQCDEYPFAATWNGGYFQPDTTSVKRINGTHNKKAGDQFGSFLQRQRVVDLTSPESPTQGDGDDFWVHIK